MWEKGQSGNPHGRPIRGMAKDLERAIKKVEKKEGKKLLIHAAEMAFTDNGVLIALLKKILPDLKQIEARIEGELGVIPLLPEERVLYQQLADKLAKQITQGGNKDE